MNCGNLLLLFYFNVVDKFNCIYFVGNGILIKNLVRIKFFVKYIKFWEKFWVLLSIFDKEEIWIYKNFNFNI